MRHAITTNLHEPRRARAIVDGLAVERAHDVARRERAAQRRALAHARDDDAGGVVL